MTRKQNIVKHRFYCSMIKLSAVLLLFVQKS